MKTLDRYLLRAFLGAFAGSLVSVAFLFTVLSVLDSITYLMGVKGASFAAIVHYYSLQLPQTIYMTAPVAALLSAMITLGALNERHELMAMRASGISMARTAAPILGAAFGISLALFALGNTLVPLGNRAFFSAKQDLNRNEEDPGRRIWYLSEARDRPPAILRIESLDRKTGRLNGLTVLETGPGFALAREIVADRADYRPGQGWELTGVKVRDFAGFAEPALSTAKTMKLEIEEKPADLLKTQRAPEEMTLPELIAQIQMVRRFGLPEAAWVVELQSRFAIPLSALILVLVGAPLAIRPVRSSGLAVGILGAIIVGFAYFVIIAEFISLGKGGQVGPATAAWSANIIFGLFGGALFSRLRK